MDHRQLDEPTERSMTLRLVPTPASVAVARRQLASFCTRNDLRVHLDTAILLISELVTNAVVHGQGNVVISMGLSGKGLRVDVSDGSPDLPHLDPAPQANRRTGRGLFLVDSLASSWRHEVHPRHGKTVTFTLDEYAPTLT